MPKSRAAKMQRRLARVQRTLDRGFWRFLLVRGVLTMGGFMAVFWIPPSGRADYWRHLSAALVVSLLSGAVLGVYLWYALGWERVKLEIRLAQSDDLA